MAFDKLMRQAAYMSPATGGHRTPCEPGSWVQYNGRPKRADMQGLTMWQAFTDDVSVAFDVKYAALVFDQWLMNARLEL